MIRSVVVALGKSHYIAAGVKFAKPFETSYEALARRGRAGLLQPFDEHLGRYETLHVVVADLHSQPGIHARRSAWSPAPRRRGYRHEVVDKEAVSSLYLAHRQGDPNPYVDLMLKELRSAPKGGTARSRAQRKSGKSA